MRDNAERKLQPPPNADVSKYVPVNADTGTLNIQFLTNTAPHKRNTNTRNPRNQQGPGRRHWRVGSGGGGHRGGGGARGGARLRGWSRSQGRGLSQGMELACGGEEARLGVWLPGKLLEWVS